MAERIERTFYSARREQHLPDGTNNRFLETDMLARHGVNPKAIVFPLPGDVSQLIVVSHAINVGQNHHEYADLYFTLELEDAIRWWRLFEYGVRKGSPQEYKPDFISELRRRFAGRFARVSVSESEFPMEENTQAIYDLIVSDTRDKDRIRLVADAKRSPYTQYITLSYARYVGGEEYDVDKLIELSKTSGSNWIARELEHLPQFSFPK